MSDEIDVYGGEIAPYNPGQPLQPLAPAPDSWGSGVDLLREDHSHQSGQGPQLFGQSLPAGATEQQVTQSLIEIQAVISSDLMRLGHPQSSISAAITWYQNNARKTPVRETKRHNYNLHDQKGDLVAESFGNAMAKAGATQVFISNCLWLLGELNKKLNTQVGSHDTKAMEGIPTSTDPLDSLTDAQYQQVLKANENAKAQTETTLRRKWGHNSYDQNIMVAQEYLNNLPAIERDYFDQYTTGFIHSLNTVPVLEGLFNMAIGSGTIPRTGGGVQAEINQIESLIRTNRKAYNGDMQIQARLRTLYDIRDR